MTLLNVERIKLFSTRSPYWCLALIVVIGLVITLVSSLVENGQFASLSSSQQWIGFGQSVVMVMAALAITTEYRFGTIRNTFLAAPRRISVLFAKTLLLALLGAVVGIVVALAAFYLAKALASAPLVPLELSTADDWRQVLGYGPLFAIAGVIAVSVGAILRQSAGAVAILLLWPLLLENLFTLIPTVGENAGPWLPFAAAGKWVAPTSSIGDLFASSGSGPTPIQGLLVFAGTGLALWIIAAVLLQKRDA